MVKVFSYCLKIHIDPPLLSDQFANVVAMSVRKLRLCWWPSEDLEKYLVEDLVQDIFEDIVEKIVESKIGKQYDNTSGANLVAKFSTTTL